MKKRPKDLRYKVKIFIEKKSVLNGKQSEGHEKTLISLQYIRSENLKCEGAQDCYAIFR